MRDLIRSLLAPFSSWKLIALHLFGNAILFAAASLWLLIPEAHSWQLIATALAATLLLVAIAWLHGGTLAHGLAATHDTLFSDLRLGLRNFLPIALVLILFFLLRGWSVAFADRSWQISGYFFTRLPHFLQTLFGETGFHKWIDFKFSALIWFFLPALFLPFLSAAAYSGFSRRALGPALRLYLRWKLWLATALAALIGVWLPTLLINWTPGHGLRREAISMALRFLAAYLLAIAAWLSLTSVVGALLRQSGLIQSSSGNPPA